MAGPAGALLERARKLDETLDALEASLNGLNMRWEDLLDGEAALLDDPEAIAQAHIAARASAQLTQALSTLRAVAKAEIA